MGCAGYRSSPAVYCEVQKLFYYFEVQIILGSQAVFILVGLEV